MTCATLRSPTSGFTTWTACAGSVLTPHDYTDQHVQKRIRQLSLGGGRPVPMLWRSFLDPQLEHAETCSNAEATRRHYACVHVAVCGMKLEDPGITTEPR